MWTKIRIRIKECRNKMVNSIETLPAEIMKEIQKEVYLQSSESIKGNYFFGFRQLTELALKGLTS